MNRTLYRTPFSVFRRFHALIVNIYADNKKSAKMGAFCAFRVYVFYCVFSQRGGGGGKARSIANLAILYTVMKPHTHTIDTDAVHIWKSVIANNPP